MKENKVIISLTSENGEEKDFELLDIVSYNNNAYAVFYPMGEVESEVVILRIQDSDKSNYIAETDEEIIKKVYKQFKEKYRGKIIFDDKKDIQ